MSAASPFEPVPFERVPFEPVPFEPVPFERVGAVPLAPRAPRLPWQHLAWGLPVAVLLGFAGPIARYMGWFLASLVHEIGHCAVALYLGHPAYPAIRLDGHAAAVHTGRSMPLLLFMWGMTAWGAWALRRRHRGAAIALGVLALLYPLLAFTRTMDVLHLLAGHMAELTFAAVAFWRSLSDVGFTASPAERALYAGVGWFLLARNVVLVFGLMTSSAARAHYGRSGSFGLENDYIRVARDVLQISLPAVAALMFLVALLVIPAAIFCVRHSSDARTR